MKNKQIIFLTAIFFIPLLFYITFIALLNFYLLPSVILPQLRLYSREHSPYTVTVHIAHISLSGKLTLQNITAAAPAVNISCDEASCRIPIRHLFSAVVAKNPYPVPLSVTFYRIQAPFPLGRVTTNATADLSLRFDRSSPEHSGISGTIGLRNAAVADIPLIGSIKNLYGTVAVDRTGIVCNDLRGSVNDTVASCRFSVSGAEQTDIQFAAELLPLSLRATCSLRNGCLQMEQVQASYRDIQLTVNGMVSDFGTDAPRVDLQFNSRLALQQLGQLPLQYQTELQNLNLSGTLLAGGTLNGILNRSENINGTCTAHADRISIGPHTVTDFALDSDLKEGILNVSRATLTFKDAEFSGRVHAQLNAPDVPFSLTLNLKELPLHLSGDVTNNPPPLTGTLNAALSLHSDLQHLQELPLELSASLNNASLFSRPFPAPITATAQLQLTDFADLTISQASISDSCIDIALSGSFINISYPQADISVEATLPLSELHRYPFGQTVFRPEDSGLLHLNGSLSGIVSVASTLTVPLTIHGGPLRLSGLSFEEISCDAELKKTQLQLTAATAALYGGSLSASGLLSFNEYASPTLTASGQANRIDLALLKNDLPAMPDMSGSLDLNIDLSSRGKNPSDIVLHSSVIADLQKGTYRDIALEPTSLNANIDWNGPDLSVKSTLISYGPLSATLNGTVGALYTKPAIDFSAVLPARLEDIAQVCTPLVPGLADWQPQGVCRIDGEFSGPLTQQALLDLKIRLNSLNCSLKGIQLDSPLCSVRYRDRTLQLNAQTDCYGGKITLSSSGEFENGTISPLTALKITDVDIGALIKDSKIVPEPHRGILNVETKINHPGADILSGRGELSFRLEKARLINVPLFTLLGNRITNLPAFSELPIDAATGTLTLNQGTISTDNTVFNGPLAIIRFSGSMLPDTRLDQCTALLTITPETARKLNRNFLREFFDWNVDGYSRLIPLKGTVLSPEIDKDVLLQEEIARRTNNWQVELNKLLGDKSEQTDTIELPGGISVPKEIFQLIK